LNHPTETNESGHGSWNTKSHHHHHHDLSHHKESIWTTDQIQQQLEYWFHDDNLHKDSYLKSLMDNEGWIEISQVAKFSRMKSHGGKIGNIFEAVSNSPYIELHSDGKKIRKKVGWEKHVSKTASIKTHNDHVNVGDSTNINTSSDATKILITKDDIDKIVGNIVKRYQKHQGKQKDKDKNKTEINKENEKDINKKNENDNLNEDDKTNKNKDDKNEKQLQQQSQ